MQQIERLYREHGSALLAYLTRSFGRCEPPEDMLHETFVQALRNQNRLGQAVSARAWLFGIARHVGLTAARRSRPRQTIEEQTIAAPADDPDLQAMRESIEQLGAELKETLELRLRERLSYEEIAQALEIPVGTVRSRLHAALRQLRDAMTEDNPSENKP
jgi:RNA polymerase sigma-70 factor (ECF subfamily)